MHAKRVPGQAGDPVWLRTPTHEAAAVATSTRWWIADSSKSARRTIRTSSSSQQHPRGHRPPRASSLAPPPLAPRVASPRAASPRPSGRPSGPPHLLLRLLELLNEEPPLAVLVLLQPPILEPGALLGLPQLVLAVALWHRQASRRSAQQTSLGRVDESTSAKPTAGKREGGDECVSGEWGRGKRRREGGEKMQREGRGEGGSERARGTWVGSGEENLPSCSPSPGPHG